MQIDKKERERDRKMIHDKKKMEANKYISPNTFFF